jgi:hypothetical protein
VVRDLVWGGLFLSGGAVVGEADDQLCRFRRPLLRLPLVRLERNTQRLHLYGGDYPGTTKDFGQVLQFQQAANCASPADGSPQYCSTVLK